MKTIVQVNREDREIELTYEHETIQGLIDLKNAINPSALVIKTEPSPDEFRDLARGPGRIFAGVRL